MIQSILFFVLGFLVAGFIALLLAPAMLRRASKLTRRRLEASLPQTPAEIRADKDRIRAEAAMTIRRLEVETAQAREKATIQLVDISRGLEQIKALANDCDDKAKTIAELEARVETQEADLARQSEALQKLSEQLAQTEKAKAADHEEMEKLGVMYDEASLTASSHQIALVARESDVDRLNNDLHQARLKRKEADARAQALSLEARVARDEAKAERKKANELDRKVNQLTAKLADSEEKLHRRETELERLREAKGDSSGSAVGAGNGGETPARVVAAQANVDQALAKLSVDRERLEERLTALARENKRLKQGSAANSPNTSGQDAALREQMNELAAQVVNLAAHLEGADSPISKVLAESPDATRPAGRQAPLSLADRIRALQKAAQPAGHTLSEK